MLPGAVGAVWHQPGQVEPHPIRLNTMESRTVRVQNDVRGYQTYCSESSNASCEICRSVLINGLVTNPYSWSLVEWRVQFAYLILHLLFSDGKLVIMVQLGSLNECDLPVVHRPQWNINRPLTADLLRICQAAVYGFIQPWQGLQHGRVFIMLRVSFPTSR